MTYVTEILIGQLKCIIRAGKTGVSLLLLYNFVNKKARCMFTKNTINFKQSVDYVCVTSSHVLKYLFNNFFYYLDTWSNGSLEEWGLLTSNTLTGARCWHQILHFSMKSLNYIENVNTSLVNFHK